MTWLSKKKEKKSFSRWYCGRRRSLSSGNRPDPHHLLFLNIKLLNQSGLEIIQATNHQYAPSWSMNCMN